MSTYLPHSVSGGVDEISAAMPNMSRDIAESVDSLHIWKTSKHFSVSAKDCLELYNTSSLCSSKIEIEISARHDNRAAINSVQTRHDADISLHQFTDRYHLRISTFYDHVASPQPRHQTRQRRLPSTNQKHTQRGTPASRDCSRPTPSLWFHILRSK